MARRILAVVSAGVVAAVLWAVVLFDNSGGPRLPALNGPSAPRTTPAPSPSPGTTTQPGTSGPPLEARGNGALTGAGGTAEPPEDEPPDVEDEPAAGDGVATGPAGSGSGGSGPGSGSVSSVLPILPSAPPLPAPSVALPPVTPPLH